MPNFLLHNSNGKMFLTIKSCSLSPVLKSDFTRLDFNNKNLVRVDGFCNS